MNEISNFCVGACYPYQNNPKTHAQHFSYIPGSRNLNQKSIDIDSQHKVGDGSTTISEIDVHSMFAYTQTKATSEWFTS